MAKGRLTGRKSGSTLVDTASGFRILALPAGVSRRMLKAGAESALAPAIVYFFLVDSRSLYSNADQRFRPPR